DISEERALTEPLFERIAGRVAAAEVRHPETQESLIKEGAEITDLQARALIQAGVTQAKVRSVLTCQAREGVCRLCYGRNLATGKMQPMVDSGTAVQEGQELAKGPGDDGQEQVLRSRASGVARVERNQIVIRSTDEEWREYLIPHGSRINVTSGQRIKAGQQITEGSISPQELLHILGREAVQTYLVDEVQKVYRSQGVDINDKHIEVIIRQMMRKVRIDSAGDTDLLPGEIVSQWEYEEANARALAEGGEPATAQTVLLGLIKAALNTTSWLSA